jgi:AcrR family transcriptional regulator
VTDPATLARTEAEVVTLPPGRHGLPADLVREIQRRRLMTAAAESLAAGGYGRITVTEIVRSARVSTGTFYKHFDGLWECLLETYEADAELLCAEIESCCAEAGGSRQERAAAAIERALETLAADPSGAYLLGAEPPPQAEAMTVARRRLVTRLAGHLGSARKDDGEERAVRLVAGALALVASRTRAGGAERLPADLGPTLAGILLSP